MEGKIVLAHFLSASAHRLPSCGIHFPLLSKSFSKNSPNTVKAEQHQAFFPPTEWEKLLKELVRKTTSKAARGFDLRRERQEEKEGEWTAVVGRVQNKKGKKERERRKKRD
jgi:hypothetical protein